MKEQIIDGFDDSYEWFAPAGLDRGLIDSLAKPSQLDRVNTNRLVEHIQENIGAVLEQFVFELNDTLTRSMIVSSIDNILYDIQTRAGLYDFRVICDMSNNSPKTINDNLLLCDVYIQPNYSVDIIEIRAIVNSNAIEMEAIILNREETYAAYERAMLIFKGR